MKKGKKGKFLILIIKEWKKGKKKKKRKKKVRILNFEGEIEEKIKRGKIRMRKMGGGKEEMR